VCGKLHLPIFDQGRELHDGSDAIFCAHNLSICLRNLPRPNLRSAHGRESIENSKFIERAQKKIWSSKACALFTYKRAQLYL
jgi:hypothetical protein